MGFPHLDIAPEWFRVSPVKLVIICEVLLEFFREWNNLVLALQFCQYDPKYLSLSVARKYF